MYALLGHQSTYENQFAIPHDVGMLPEGAVIV
jgi:hypothetical protein